MKGKRVVALALTGCLMFGQTAWAEGTGGEKEQSEITQEEQTVDNSEQEDAGSEQTVIQSDAGDDVTVKERPEDAIVFQDSNLEAKLLNTWDGIDENKDGYISKSEMLKLKNLYISDSNITDLSGLEYAENLERIILRGNKELKDVHVLSELENLKYIDLRGTGVSTDDKWKLANIYSELQLSLGDKINCIINGKIFDDGESVIEKVSGDDVVSIDGSKLFAEKKGIELLKITAGNNSKNITVEVKGIPAEQEVGENSDASINDYAESTILGSNGELWEVYPEPKRLNKNVKRYVGGYVYLGEETIEYAYHLQQNNSLWSDDQKLAENVEKFSGLYALDKKGTLIDIYNEEVPKVENVISWVEYVGGQDTGVDSDGSKLREGGYWIFFLKNDGTLWRRKENNRGEVIPAPEKISENVELLGEEGYLCKNGQYISFDGENNLSNAASLPTGPVYCQYYTGTDGHTHFCAYEEWIDLGKVNIKKADYNYTDDYEFECYYLTDENELYRITDSKVGKSKVEKVASDVQKFGRENYKGTDGLWRKYSDGKSGTTEEPVVVQTVYSDESGDHIWKLEDYGVANDYNVKKNDIFILNHVKELVLLGKWGEKRVYAIRTDGTLWDITGVPEKLVDLNSGKMLAGDVNADGEVDIQDLRSILRYVCEKEEFDEDQKSAADVDANGEVDIKDLRKVIRYVSGKESAL